MRIAILTDIHANREAFEAVLADVALRGSDRIGILGDVVGYGPDPAWCTDRVRELVATGAFCIKGNHDSAISNKSEHLNVTALRAINWTRQLLSPDQTEFLAGLPMTHAEGDILFVHAWPTTPPTGSTSAAKARRCHRFASARPASSWSATATSPRFTVATWPAASRRRRLPPGSPRP